MPIALLFMLVSSGLLGQTAQIVLVHVALVDPNREEIQSDMTVVVDSRRISRVEKTRSKTWPRGSVVIDGRGKFLIPGLWDMHGHTSNSPFSRSVFLPLLIANGITGVRSMFDDLTEIRQIRKEIEQGSLIGPRVYSPGPIVDGPKPEWRGSIAVTDGESGRAAVQRLKSDGADFIKVYSSLPRVAYFAVAEEARSQSLAFAGHVPHTVRVSEASDAGQRSIEHSFDLLTATSAEEDEIVKQWSREEAGEAPGISTYSAMVRAVDHAGEHRVRTLCAKLAANGTWVCPTLALSRAYAQAKERSFREDPRLSYMPAKVVERWRSSGFSVASQAAAANMERAFRRATQNVRSMYRAHVSLLAGTDFPNPFMLPGFSLHDELKLLVDAGLTPRDALRSATTEPLRYFGLNSDVFVPGMPADLVLLDANPSLNIESTRKIRAVIASGRLFTRSQLDDLMAGAKAAANHP